jgi:hypothetical protein
MGLLLRTFCQPRVHPATGYLFYIITCRRTTGRLLLEELGKEAVERTTAHLGDPFGKLPALRRQLQEDISPGSYQRPGYCHTTYIEPILQSGRHACAIQTKEVP